MSSSSDPVFDVAIVGGGINGCGIARDAAGRGARVLLLEAGDLASGTSSASTKLIHGGLRYLEHYEFALVREALFERERLLRIAPHIAWPLRFVMPLVPGLRPRWLLRLGLFLYDHIGGRRLLPPTQAVDLPDHVAGAPLKPDFDKAFVYSDCWVDDARLVVLNARDAADRGAQVRTRCPVTSFKREGDQWRIATPQGVFQARALVNAAGPGVARLLELGQQPASRQMRLVRGSHIVVPRLFDHGFAYFFQLLEGRIFFAIPYENDFTLIGTTDVDHRGEQDEVAASEVEIAYLCEAANRFFRRSIGPSDLVWSYSGVRPLISDGSDKPEAATRGYWLDLSKQDEGCPLLTIYGGKLTTYRHLGESAVDLLAERLPELRGPGWTADMPLPGGDFDVRQVAQVRDELARQYPFLEPCWVERLVRSYGRLTADILGNARCLHDCGRHFGHGLTEREVDYLARREWAGTAEDILWRRTKLGLRLTADQVSDLTNFLKQRTTL